MNFNQEDIDKLPELEFAKLEDLVLRSRKRRLVNIHRAALETYLAKNGNVLEMEGFRWEGVKPDDLVDLLPTYPLRRLIIVAQQACALEKMIN